MLLESLINLGLVCLELMSLLGIVILLVVMTVGVSIVGAWTYTMVISIIRIWRQVTQ